MGTTGKRARDVDDCRHRSIGTMREVCTGKRYHPVAQRGCADLAEQPVAPQRLGML